MWGGTACAAAVLVAGSSGVERLGRVHFALRLSKLGSAAWRGVGCGGRQQGGFDLGIGSD